MASKMTDFSDVWERDFEPIVTTVKPPGRKNVKRDMFLQDEENEPTGKIIFTNDIFIAEIGEKTKCLTFIPKYKHKYIKVLSKRRFDIIRKSYFPIMIPKDISDPEKWFSQNYLNTNNKKQRRFINEIWKHKSEIFEAI